MNAPASQPNASPVLAELGLAIETWPAWLSESGAKADLAAGWDLGARWAAALRFRYGKGLDAPEKCGKDFQVNARTARAWLQGAPPYLHHLPEARRLLGTPTLLQVLLPHAPSPSVERFDALLDDIAADLERLRFGLVLMQRSA